MAVGICPDLGPPLGSVSPDLSWPDLAAYPWTDLAGYPLPPTTEVIYQTMPTPKKIVRSLASRLPGSASLRRRITRAGLRRPRHTPSKSRNESFVGEDENAPTPSRFPEFAPNKKKTKTGSPSTEGDSDNGSGAISNDSPGGSDGIDDDQICPVQIDFGGRDTESSGENDIILEDNGIENGMMDDEGGASTAFDDDDAIDSDANQPCPMHVDAAQLEENDSTQEDESNLDMLVDDESGALTDVDSLVDVTKRTWKVNESVYYQLIEKENEEEENVERVGAGAGAKSKAKITWIEASIRDIVEIPHYALVLAVDDDDYVPTEGLKSPVSDDDEVTVGAADIARLVKRRDEVSCNLDPRQKHNRRLRRYHYRRGTKEAHGERSGAKLEYVSTSDALAANVQHAEGNMTEACKLMRDGDGKKCPGLVTMIMNLMTMPHVERMIRKATDGNEGATFENALMWMIGQELGIEIQESFRGEGKIYIKSGFDLFACLLGYSSASTRLCWGPLLKSSVVATSSRSCIVQLRRTIGSLTLSRLERRATPDSLANSALIERRSSSGRWHQCD